MRSYISMSWEAVFVFLWDKVSGMPMTLFRWAESSGDSLTGQSRVTGGDY